jgi:hypothetical protein
MTIFSVFVGAMTMIGVSIFSLLANRQTDGRMYVAVVLMGNGDDDGCCQ